MVWLLFIIIIFLAFIVYAMSLQIKSLERSLERLNEQLESHHERIYKKIEQYDGTLERLSERFAYKPHFESEQIKLENLRHEVRSINDKLYYIDDIVQERKEKSLNELLNRL